MSGQSDNARIDASDRASLDACATYGAAGTAGTTATTSSRK